MAQKKTEMLKFMQCIMVLFSHIACSWTVSSDNAVRVYQKLIPVKPLHHLEFIPWISQKRTMKGGDRALLLLSVCHAQSLVSTMVVAIPKPGHYCKVMRHIVTWGHQATTIHCVLKIFQCHFSVFQSTRRKKDKADFGCKRRNEITQKVNILGSHLQHGSKT